MVHAENTSDLRRQQRPAGQTIELPAPHEREDAAGTQSEQRDGDRQKREVVVHDDGKNPCQRQFRHEQSGGDAGDTNERLDGDVGADRRHGGPV